MGSILALGEGMVELKMNNGELEHKFAGDTLNAAIYGKRWANDLDIYFYSAVGEDLFSQQMLDYLATESLSTQAILTTPESNIGIYAIQTDESGERSFTYWRKDSAATHMVELLDAAGGIDALPSADCVFLSGISLGILSDQNKKRLFELLELLKARGSKIAFDPNFRPRMWRDTEHAVEWIAKAYQISDIALPGLDEHEDIFGHKSVEDVRDFLQAHDVSEFVIKAGKQGVYAFNSTEGECHIAFNPAPKQVDSTAAGDSFAGTFLASRVSGSSLLESIKNADSVAREVVQHSGAIIDKHLYKKTFNANKK